MSLFMGAIAPNHFFLLFHIDIINMKTQNENHLRKEVTHMSDDQVIVIASDDVLYG